MTAGRAAFDRLLAQNRTWARAMEAERPGFFAGLSGQQRPRYMWIGCSDSRVPANQITGLQPGEVFVHRNVANLVVHSDLNALSAVQFAVDRLRVEHILVVGHHGCSGVQAALDGTRIGLADHWIRHVRDVRARHDHRLAEFPRDVQPLVLCELNVLEQVANICASSVLADAWAAGQPLHVHACVYSLKDGLLRDLGMSIADGKDLPASYCAAVERLFVRSRSGLSGADACACGEPHVVQPEAEMAVQR
ncbi:MAG: carbonate dehydratase [Pseudomonadota bacterium]